MTDKQADLRAASEQADAARARLSGTASALQRRLQPASLAREARRGLGEVGAAALDGARNNPAPVAGAIVALGLFLARKPLGRLVRRATGRARSRSPNQS